MSRIPYILFLFSFTTVCSYAQHYKKDWDEMGLKGKVKYMESCQYKPVEKAGIVVKGEKVIDNWIDLDRHIFFNESGNIKEEKDYSINNELFKTSSYTYNKKGENTRIDTYKISDGKHSFSLFYYNGKGNLLRYEYYGPDSKLEEYSIAKFDKRGNLMKWKFFYENILRDKWLNKYDKKDRIIQHQYIAGNDPQALHDTSTYTYDDKGNMIEYISTQWYAGKSFYRYTATYNEKGQMMEKRYILPNSEMATESLITYEYDQWGSLVVELTITYLKDKTFKQSKNSAAYKYDPLGNWIEKIEYKDDKPVKMYERKIEYF